MSKLTHIKKYNQVELWFTNEEQIGTFQILDCDRHGNELHFTDKSGADNCVECIRLIIEPTEQYDMPFGDIEESLEKLTIRSEASND